MGAVARPVIGAAICRPPVTMRTSAARIRAIAARSYGFGKKPPRSTAPVARYSDNPAALENSLMPMPIRWPLATGCVCAEPKHQQLQALREEAAAAPTRQKAAATPLNLLSGVRVVRMTAGARARA